MLKLWYAQYNLLYPPVTFFISVLLSFLNFFIFFNLKVYLSCVVLSRQNNLDGISFLTSFRLARHTFATTWQKALYILLIHQVFNIFNGIMWWQLRPINQDSRCNLDVCLSTPLFLNSFNIVLRYI